MKKNFLNLASFLFLLLPAQTLAQTNTISSTVSSTVSSSSNTVGTTTVDRTPSTANSPNVVVNNSDICTTGVRSEERRVGKAGRCRGEKDKSKKTG